ncbi:MAG: DUF59 domain-containing protein [Thermoanaerobaculales bacterium]|nr:DUF59 domain-containing protein [Thermoanaerobaculales bacterium]
MNSELKTRIIDMLKTIYDPEIPANIYDIGLIYEVTISDERDVSILMTLTSPMCPVAESLPPDVQFKVGALEGVGSVEVEVTWDPPWSPDLMSEAAQLELGMF